MSSRWSRWSSMGSHDTLRLRLPNRPVSGMIWPPSVILHTLPVREINPARDSRLAHPAAVLELLVVYVPSPRSVEAPIVTQRSLSDTEALRLQMAMDQTSKLMATLSNNLKKMSDTAAAIAQNLK